MLYATGRSDSRSQWAQETFSPRPKTTLISVIPPWSKEEFVFMFKQRVASITLFVLGCLAAFPAAALAQRGSGIAGVVRDTSGGVLPGVTVEAASPALIEKVRSVATDADGRYSL